MRDQPVLRRRAAPTVSTVSRRVNLRRRITGVLQTRHTIFNSGKGACIKCCAFADYALSLRDIHSELRVSLGISCFIANRSGLQLGGECRGIVWGSRTLEIGGRKCLPMSLHWSRDGLEADPPVEPAVGESRLSLARPGFGGLRRRCQRHQLILVRLVMHFGSGFGRAAMGSHQWPTTKLSLRSPG